MDGIWPTIVFFCRVTPILGTCGLIGFLVAYSELQSQERGLLNLAITILVGTAVFWYVFAPPESGWLTHAVILGLGLMSCFFSFVAGGHAGDRKKRHSLPGLGYIPRNWDLEG